MYQQERKEKKVKETEYSNPNEATSLFAQFTEQTKKGLAVCLQASIS